MSHHPNIISPPGTTTADRTVGELVAERPGRSRVFQDFKIDFCCQGGRTLREACERRGVALESVLEQLEAEQHSNKAPDFNPAELPPTQLADFIVKTHHTFLRQELPRLHMMAERVAHVHGGHTPSLVTIFEVFQGMEDELISHMAKEEQVLFPAIRALEAGQPSFGPLDGPISCMMHEHEDAGSALAEMRALSHDYSPPIEACNTYRALFAGLQDLEEDLHRHIHLENSILFPAAQQLASAAG
ncbi:MAG: iron-sulfur cluster repair di-iron protein [Prosthecobacter sp.]|jgi:regulator of cell morphogenesis and NO signaling|uniref:iron-sulfur cluster repair di-iron protein n=1 Tax=Prosthecobacter sp. TaxID=1965333 RepID=UPI0019D83970|nr:iron-sulfur cluster repair di-iron protein [Prosthecobacter sp.]MBE2284893.1 iron-sulfur cluster repair di-iron protein [Prosthecobacter sp.]